MNHNFVWYVHILKVIVQWFCNGYSFFHMFFCQKSLSEDFFLLN